jgi:hypothetical protein
MGRKEYFISRLHCYFLYSKYKSGFSINIYIYIYNHVQTFRIIYLGAASVHDSKTSSHGVGPKN